MNVLVTGGAGYIGAHLVRLLTDRGDHVVVADDLVTGRRSRICSTPVVQVNLAADDAVGILSSVLAEHEVESVVHFAARKQAGESVERPAWYFQQNIGGLANVLLAIESVGVSRFLFSSSSAVYAESDQRITEDYPVEPHSPYGESKLVGEWLTRDSTIARDLTAVSLRYFNVAGAGVPELGDTAVLNLIPMVLEKLDAGQSPVIFGNDYPTPDGTCVRDYIHVQDVAEAHLAALDGLDQLGTGHHIFNVGTGHGVSVLQIVDAVLKEAESELTPVVAARRPGDLAAVVASVDRIAAALGWHARFDLHDMVSSAWEAHQFERARK